MFAPYHFALQQFHTNFEQLNDEICDSSISEECETKLLGTKWNKIFDSIYPNPINLDASANTRRKVLKTLHSIYDILNIYAPMLNRAKLFLQKVQLNASLGWDKQFPKELQREWTRICRQVNGCPPIELPRQFGDRNDEYSLFAFKDASKELYGAVIYIKNLSTGKVSYFISKVKVVCSSNLKKTIPALEFQAITLGVEMLIDVNQQLAGENTVMPIIVRDLSLFTDSMVAMHWLQNFSIKLDKMQRVSTFVMNRMHKIEGLCNTKAVTFNFVDGTNNPADHLTRCVSHKKLVKTNFHTGPIFLEESDACPDSDLRVIMPNPSYVPRDEVICYTVNTKDEINKPSFERFSSFLLN